MTLDDMNDEATQLLRTLVEVGGLSEAVVGLLAPGIASRLDAIYRRGAADMRTRVLENLAGIIAKDRPKP